MDDSFTVIVYSVSDRPFWRVYSVPKEGKITYQRVLQVFLGDYQDFRKDEITNNVVKYTISSLDRPFSADKVIDNWNSGIDSDKELLISRSDLKEEKRMATRKISTLSFGKKAREFWESKNYRSAKRFYNLGGNCCLAEALRFLYQLDDWKYISQYVDIGVALFPADHVLKMIKGLAYEKNGEKQNALLVYEANKETAPVFKIAYERLKLLSMSLIYVEDIVKEALESCEGTDHFILNEVLKLRVQNGQIKEACDTLMMNMDFLSENLESFCKIPEQAMNLRYCIQHADLFVNVTIQISRKMYDYGATDESIKLAKYIFLKNQTNYLCAFSYLNLLFKCYRYDRLVIDFARFLSWIPKYFKSLNKYQIVETFKSSSIFRGKSFELRAFESEQKNDMSEENFKYFIYIMMTMSHFYFLIGDVQFFRNIVRIIEKFVVVTPDVPLILYNTQMMYQSIMKISNQASPINDADSNLLVIGDIHAISCGNTKVELQGQTHHITSLPIEDLSIFDLRPENISSNKTLFYRFIQRSNHFPAVMIVLGTKDVEEIIPKYYRKGTGKLSQHINTIIQIYLSILDEIEQIAPNTSIIVHTAFSRSPATVMIAKLFNEELRKYMQAKFKFVCPFPANPANNFFALPGIEDGLPDSRYPERLRRLFKTICM